MDEQDEVDRTNVDYINQLNRDQNEVWQDVEDDFRRKFMDLIDKHMHETQDLLRNVQAMNPTLYDAHLMDAQKEADKLRA